MNLLDSPNVGFDEPIEMLYACHGKVRRFCDQINRLHSYLKENGYNTTAQQAVKQIRHYFDTAAPLHHLDEEQDFFPLLLQYAPQAQHDVQTLLNEHDHLHECWQALSATFRQLEQQPQWLPENTVLTQFTQAYAQHLALEEPLFALGKQTIPNDRLSEIGKNMAARRQQN